MRRGAGASTPWRDGSCMSTACRRAARCAHRLRPPGLLVVRFMEEKLRGMVDRPLGFPDGAQSDLHARALSGEIDRWQPAVLSADPLVLQLDEPIGSKVAAELIDVAEDEIGFKPVLLRSAFSAVG